MNERCAIIPAAGRGSRLGLDGPKILAPLGERTIWDVLADRALQVCARVHVVLSPNGLAPFCERLRTHCERARVSTSVQDVPRGMGDAIFGCREHWSAGREVVVMWGDQVGLSRATMDALADAFAGPHDLVLPLARDPKPYVEYLFDGRGRLTKVLQSREGDATRPGGQCDVGLFGMSVDGLCDAWDRFARDAPFGSSTGEVNFLPFFPFLSSTLGWAVREVEVLDPDEARGVNTADDLEFHKLRLERSSG